MREILLDVISHTSALVKMIKVTGTDEETRLEAVSDDKIVIIAGKLKDTIPDFEGVFGITNLSFLKGLLDFSSYKADGASFSVKRAEIGGNETVEAFEFRDSQGAGADFRTRSSGLGDLVEIRNIPWEVSFEPSKSKINEFLQLTKLYSEIDKNFTIKTDDGKLVFMLGNEDSSMHRATLIMENEIEGEIKGQAFWPIAEFTKIIQIAGHAKTMEIKVNGRGVLGIFTETNFGSYTYYLRGSR